MFQLTLPLKIITALLLVVINSQAIFAQEELDVASSKTVAKDMSSTVLNITLHENTGTLSLYSDGTCSIDDGEKITLNQDNQTWLSIVGKPYLKKLSGLRILEQVKQEVRQSRVEMDIDSEDESTLIITHNNNIREITLYSVDMMHSTYPNASQLSQFIEVLTLMREAKSACVN